MIDNARNRGSRGQFGNASTTVGRKPPRARRTGSGGGDQTAGEPVGAASVLVLLSQRAVAAGYPPGTTMVSDWLVVGSTLYDVRETGSS